MKIDVAEILKEPGASVSFDTAGELSYEGLKTVGPVRVRGVATSTGDGIYVEAHASGKVSLVCSRCLAEFVRDFSVSCEGKFTATPREEFAEDEEEGQNIEEFQLEGTVCSLDEMVAHEVLLSLPMKPLCKPDCRGLCPVCGKNLNEGPCDCDKTRDGVTAFGRKLLEALEERSK